MVFVSTYFAIPSRGELNWQCAQAIRELAEELDAEPHFQIGHLSVAANRNKICEDFLASDCETLFMLDDDVMPAANAVFLVDDLAKFDIVAAAVPVWRAQDPAPSFAAFGSDQQPLQPNALYGPLAEAAFVGTGCIAIKRDVILTLFEVSLEPFRVEVRDGLTVSEDVIFCEQARECGFSVACDFRVRCDHWMKVSLRRVLKLSA